ncbi:MAG: ATP phosphoribosyltransferase regulatory subunit [Spirochaetales bacterium]|nr:ATP phosphoribosyltransferase regulatory subunit [Spirochaetales bacterium]
MSQQLRVPQGTESFFLEEALRHKDILRQIEDQYKLWGYLPVQTPMVDFYDSYGELLDKKRQEESYRMISREGDLLILRSDITLFLARQMALILEEDHCPVRVYYSDSILRYQNHEDISHNEFFQTGCELIGKKDLDGDLEVIMLLHDQLEELSLPPFRIHIGSRALFRRLLANAGAEEKEKELSLLLDTRDYDGLCEVLPAEAVDLLFFIGTLTEFRDKLTKLSSSLKKSIKEVSEDFTALIDQLEKTGKAESFRIDLSEIGGQPYYTGFVFQAYMEGADRAVASGGRYDDLFGRFGKKFCSVGFSLLLRKIEKLMDVTERKAPVQLDGGKKDFAALYKEAAERRDRGESVRLG